MKVYAIWYRLAGDTEDRIRGCSSSKNRAERLAKMLDFVLRQKGIISESIGIKEYVDGNVTALDDYVTRRTLIPASRPHK